MAGGSARWRLEILGPDGGRRAVPLGREVVVGRDQSADLRLDDQSVSRQHAKLYFDEAGALWVEDLGSGNGVVLDGVRLREATKVPSGARMKLGVFTLTAQDVLGPPAALAKAGGKGEAPADPANDARVAKAKAAAGPPPPSGCAFRGRTGAFLNKDFPLAKPLVKVGRVAEGNDLALQDDSISREHARLSRSGRGYVVRDLGSANGTSVNGVRVLEQPLGTGDIVRFGTLEFEYFGPPAMVHKPLDPKKRRLAILAAVSLTGLLIVMGTAKVLSVSREGPVQQASGVQDDVSESERRVGLAQDARRDEQWDRATKEYQEAIRLDPINRDARKGLKDVEVEIQMKQLFDRARQRVDVGQDEEGAELYLKIVPSSSYYPRAQAEVQRLASLLVRRYQEQCRTSAHYGDQQGIVEGCGHYLNLICNSRADEKTLQLLRAAEHKLGAKVQEPWSCPASYAHWALQDGSSKSASLEGRINLMYPNPRLAEAVRIYANGQARAALNGLRNLKEIPAESHNPAVEKLLRSIELSYGAYTDGVSSLETGDLRNARQQWQLLFDTDKQIMPEGFQSELANQAKKQLAKQYYKVGLQLFQQQRLIDAFQTWEQGFQVLPGDNELQQGFISLEHEAEKILANASSCVDIKQALAITLANPPSLSHKRAQKIATKEKCKL